MTEFEDIWAKLVIAVIGGDEREQEIARLAAATGATVRAFGFPLPGDDIAGVEFAKSPEAALAGARFALMPIPGIATDGSLFASQKIVPRKAMLSVMADGAHIILGATDDGLRSAADAHGITIHEYERDQELMLLRAPAIVEAAIRIIIENTAITIHNSKICIIGQGNIGTVLARTLVAIGAHVTVAARNPVQRAAASTFGAAGLPLEELGDAASGFDMILSTVPAPVVSAAIIDRAKPGALIMDLSAPPGGVDLDYARKKGHTAIWARALGRRAPITVGGSQWSGIARIIETILREDA